MFFIWLGFFTIIGLLLALDLGVFNRKAHVISLREATWMSAFWISIGVAFTGVIYLLYEYDISHITGGSEHAGFEAASQYITAYLIEKALSVDNIVIIALLFRYFQVPPEYQHRVLFWGILGAIISRGILIVLGAALVEQFDWIFYIFGVILVVTALKMIFGKEEEPDLDKSRLIRLAHRIFPIVNIYDEDRFITVVDGRRAFTLLALALVTIEGMDIVFAVDSIPAAFGVTTDSFIILTSNIFAILGLRSLYFVVAGVMHRFRYLQMAVSVVLLLVGVKMLIHDLVEIDATWSLLLVVGVLGLGVLFSLLFPSPPEEDTPSPS